MVFGAGDLLHDGLGTPDHFVAALVNRHAIDLRHGNRHAIRLLAIAGLADVVVTDTLLRSVARLANRLEGCARADVRRRTRIAAWRRRTASGRSAAAGRRRRAATGRLGK